MKRWEFYEYNVSSWKKVFRIPYICTKSTKLQTLQYRILHRYIPTRRYLFIRNVVDAPHCLECQQMDTLEHFLFKCEKVKPLWNRLFEGINRTSLNSTGIVIFGAVSERPAINLLILLVKQYIVQCKLAPVTLTPSVQGLISFITYHIDIERRIAVSNNNIESFCEKWSGFLDETQSLNLFADTQNRSQGRET